jgi:hypothetical protein
LLAVVLLAGVTLGSVTTAQDIVTRDTNQATVGTQAYLGLGVAPLHPALTAQLPDVIGEGRGVLVEQVMKGSPAEQAGLRQYDVLVQYNNQDLYAPEQFVKLIRNAAPGSQAMLTYVRGGKLHDTKVTLGEIPMQAPVRGRRSFRLPFLDRFVQPWQPQAEQPRLEEPQVEQPRVEQPRTPWGAFESMTITKHRDGTYKVKIEYRDAEEKQIHREYMGTREEIKKAIEADKELPANERQHVLRSLDKHERPQFVLPWREDRDRELFTWPHLDF